MNYIGLSAIAFLILSNINYHMYSALYIIHCTAGFLTPAAKKTPAGKKMPAELQKNARQALKENVLL